MDISLKKHLDIWPNEIRPRGEDKQRVRLLMHPLQRNYSDRDHKSVAFRSRDQRAFARSNSSLLYNAFDELVRELVLRQKKYFPFTRRDEMRENKYTERFSNAGKSRCKRRAINTRFARNFYV